MTITDRNLAPGTRLEAKYKGLKRFATVLEDGTIKLDGDEDGKTYKSPSAAGSAVMGGIACNGWRFWGLADTGTDVAAPPPAPTAPAPSKGRKGRGGVRSKVRKFKVISLMEEQPSDLEEGQAAYWCSACGKSFIGAADAVPEVCANGHRADDPELTGGIEAVEDAVAEASAMAEEAYQGETPAAVEMEAGVE